MWRAFGDKRAGLIFMIKGNSVPDYVGIGFKKIDHDLQFLIECLGEVLEEMGLTELAAHLPWFGKKAHSLLRFGLYGGAARGARAGLLLGMAFQLLNMVEENAAAYVRTLRETSEGLSAERGLWGERLEKLKNRRRDGRRDRRDASENLRGKTGAHRAPDRSETARGPRATPGALCAAGCTPAR